MKEEAVSSPFPLRPLETSLGSIRISATGFSFLPRSTDISVASRPPALARIARKTLDPLSGEVRGPLVARFERHKRGTKGMSHGCCSRRRRAATPRYRATVQLFQTPGPGRPRKPPLYISGYLPANGRSRTIDNPIAADRSGNDEGARRSFVCCFKN